MSLKYEINIIPEVHEVIEVYKSSGINRPVHDAERIWRMYANSNLVVTARDQNRLVGVGRALTDLCYSCYVSDLAVSKEYQRQGIGKGILKMMKEYEGEQSMLLLLSAQPAMEYYPKLGMEKVSNGFIIKRKE